MLMPPIFAKDYTCYNSRGVPQISVKLANDIKSQYAIFTASFFRKEAAPCYDYNGSFVCVLEIEEPSSEWYRIHSFKIKKDNTASFYYAYGQFVAFEENYLCK